MRTMFGSRSWQYNLTKMRSVPLVRCLPKDVVVDSHWFTDCHLEAIFNMNTARLQQSASISDHRRQEKCSSDHRRFSLNPAQHDIVPHRQSQLSDLTEYSQNGNKRKRRHQNGDKPKRRHAYSKLTKTATRTATNENGNMH